MGNFAELANLKPRNRFITRSFSFVHANFVRKNRACRGGKMLHCRFCTSGPPLKCAWGAPPLPHQDGAKCLSGVPRAVHWRLLAPPYRRSAENHTGGLRSTRRRWACSRRPSSPCRSTCSSGRRTRRRRRRRPSRRRASRLRASGRRCGRPRGPRRRGPRRHGPRRRGPRRASRASPRSSPRARGGPRRRCRRGPRRHRHRRCRRGPRRRRRRRTRTRRGGGGGP